MSSNLNQKINDINQMIMSWDLLKAEEEALLLYSDNKELIILLNLLWNIYNWKLEPLKAVEYLEKANELSKWSDWHILFNLWVSYSNIDKNKASEYLQAAKKILPDDSNLDNFINNL